MEEAEKVAGRLLRELSAITVNLPERTVRIAASCGIALFPQHGSTVEELLVAADRALYAAKYSGGACWRVSDPTHAQDSASSRLSAHELETALAHGALSLVAQPILDLRCGSIVGCELLVRLRQGERLLGPGAFLPVAERLSLMPQIDLWMVQRGLAFARRHGTRVHINLHAQTVRDAERLEAIQDLLVAAGLPDGTVVFELTETAAVIDIARLRYWFEQFRRLG
jgi:predicted signal transduction protein with EAL and GGDEF domain